MAKLTIHNYTDDLRAEFASRGGAYWLCLTTGTEEITLFFEREHADKCRLVADAVNAIMSGEALALRAVAKSCIEAARKIEAVTEEPVA